MLVRKLQPFRALMTSCRVGQERSLNHNLERLMRMPTEKLAYRVMRLQRDLEACQAMCDPAHLCGRDKVRVGHPDPDEIVVGRESSRKIALKLLYLGWDYLGFAWEDRSRNQQYVGRTNVVERVLIEALLRQQLIPRIGSMGSMRMERCGRTDRLVSGISQVVTIRVRSNLERGFGVWGSTSDPPDVHDSSSDASSRRTNVAYHEEGHSIDDASLDEGELPYVALLNEALPTDIRVLAWSPVGRFFNPRRHCSRRSYRYVFPRGVLDVDVMNEAAQKFVGKHDFRNFCSKSDDNLFKHFDREIFYFSVRELRGDGSLPECDMCVATISGQSFLHKQIRKMMAMLALIGLGEAPKEIIDELLDVGKSPRKPGYPTLNAINLMLVDCSFDDDMVSWRWNSDAIVESSKALAALFGKNAAQAETLRHMYATLCSRMERAESRRDAAFELTNSLTTNAKEMKLGDELSKTVEEKRETSRRRALQTLLHRGAYSKAARLRLSQTDDQP